MDSYLIEDLVPPTPSGEGKKHMMILLPPGELTAQTEPKLKAMTQAIGYDLNMDTYIIEADRKISIAHFIQQLDLTHIISFGISAEKLGMHMENYVPYYFYRLESCHLLYSHSLIDMLGDVSKKKALWKALQQEFLSNPA